MLGSEAWSVTAGHAVGMCWYSQARLWKARDLTCMTAAIPISVEMMSRVQGVAI